MADVDRLVQVDQFARLPQPVEELAEILFHFQGLHAPAGVTKRRNLLIAGGRSNTRNGMVDVFRSPDRALRCHARA